MAIVIVIFIINIVYGCNFIVIKCYYYKTYFLYYSHFIIIYIISYFSIFTIKFTIIINCFYHIITITSRNKLTVMY